MRKAALHNLGCKVNAYETEAMSQILEKAGYQIVPFEEKADVYVINTCSVTNIADRKSRQMLHRARKRNPDAVVVAAGCYVQAAGEILGRDEAVDILIGNNKKTELARILERYFQGREQERKEKTRTEEAAGREEKASAETTQRREEKTETEAEYGLEEKASAEITERQKKESTETAPEREEKTRTEAGDDREEIASAETAPEREEKTQTRTGEKQEELHRKNLEAEKPDSGENLRKYIIDIGKTSEYEALHIEKVAEHTRAFIKIQDGCNQFCSYCIIPYTRGRIRSRKPEEIAAEVETLVKQGYQEIVLTGIHLSSYGMDVPEETRETLAELMVRLDRIEGLKRMRLGSLEPRIVTEEFVKTLAGLRTLCPHFHLSLQSGCDSVLKRMNRHYTTKEYRETCGLLRTWFENPAITTDVIVGFPQETEEEFQETVNFLEEIRFYEMHVFKYSRREGTRAARMEGQVAEPIKAARSDILLEAEARMSQAYRKSLLGRKRQVLMEEKTVINGTEYLAGYTKEYVKAAIPWDERRKGTMVTGILTQMLTEDILLLTEENGEIYKYSLYE